VPTEATEFGPVLTIVPGPAYRLVPRCAGTGGREGERGAEGGGGGATA
jgi:hypothetical protein